MAVLVTPPDLARTYHPQSYEDAWQAVEDYQRVLEYTGRHPNKGSSAVASALNLPRGRVHPWMNGSRPAPVRAIQIAEEHDWLPLTTDDKHFPAFNRLVAWIFSRGSITDADYSPQFSCHHNDEQQRLETLFETLDIKYEIYRADSTDRATEARITDHRTIIGRLLVQLGAPHGPRTNATSLPTYLTPPSDTAATSSPHTTSAETATSEPLATADSDGSQTIEPLERRSYARTFAETYVANTARYWEWQDGYLIKHEDRAPDFLRSLAAVFEFASNESGIEINSDSLFLPAALAEDLCPHPLSGENAEV